MLVACFWCFTRMRNVVGGRYRRVSALVACIQLTPLCFSVIHIETPAAVLLQFKFIVFLISCAWMCFSGRRAASAMPSGHVRRSSRTSAVFPSRGRSPGPVRRSLVEDVGGARSHAAAAATGTMPTPRARGVVCGGPIALRCITQAKSLAR